MFQRVFVSEVEFAFKTWTTGEITKFNDGTDTWKTAVLKEDNDYILMVTTADTKISKKDQFSAILIVGAGSNLLDPSLDDASDLSSRRRSPDRAIFNISALYSPEHGRELLEISTSRYFECLRSGEDPIKTVIHIFSSVVDAMRVAARCRKNRP